MDSSLVTLAVVALMSILPFGLLMLTSFVKVIVVLSLLRSAIGAAEVPPTLVITGLSLVLTLFIMAPVGARVVAEVEPVLAELPASAGSRAALPVYAQALERAKEPVRTFLIANARQADRLAFAELARSLDKEQAGMGDTDLLVLAPAFVTTELREAFAIGFLVFIPFLIIDLLVASVLVSLGLHLTPPANIALPIKLLLFVLVDGWQLVARGLIAGYA